VDTKAVSVIIRLTTAASAFRACSRALDRQSAHTDSLEAVVVDDGSSDGTAIG